MATHSCPHPPSWLLTPPQRQERLGGAFQLPRAQQPTCPDIPVHTCTEAPRCARLTYGREWHKSLDEKAGGRGELVGFLNQDIKAHLRKRKQRECVLLQRPGEEGAGGGRAESEGHHLALQLHPRPTSSAPPEAAEPQCSSLKLHCPGVPVNWPGDSYTHARRHTASLGTGQGMVGWLLSEESRQLS